MTCEISLTYAQIIEAVKEWVNLNLQHAGSTDWVSVAATIALVCLTALLAYYTKILAVEARKTREQQTEPNVIVTANHDANRPTIILLVIKNIGNGLAQNVKFEMSQPLSVAFGFGGDTDEKSRPIERGPLITGIPSLGPGESRVLFWGQPGGLSKAIGSDVITITCRYECAGKGMPPSVSSIDIESFMGTVADESFELRAVKALESIAHKISPS